MAGVAWHIDRNFCLLCAYIRYSMFYFLFFDFTVAHGDRKYYMYYVKVVGIQFVCSGISGLCCDVRQLWLHDQNRSHVSHPIQMQNWIWLVKLFMNGCHWFLKWSEVNKNNLANRGSPEGMQTSEHRQRWGLNHKQSTGGGLQHSHHDTTPKFHCIQIVCYLLLLHSYIVPMIVILSVSVCNSKIKKN